MVVLATDAAVGLRAAPTRGWRGCAPVERRSGDDRDVATEAHDETFRQFGEQLTTRLDPASDRLKK
jgi:hypothetical protein